MPTRNINLTDRLDAFIESGMRLERLRAAAEEGEEAYRRGEFADIEPEALASHIARHGATARR
ncbi:hypothetical protein [Enterovirga aerilata]|uniref:hypothetical protein n=1 Tax=Enterovirga aerilata TaxID=2730920 RepID=UPI001AEE28CD|nr:hypothetical protein [Enterovirga sp. DB1703]